MQIVRLALYFMSSGQKLYFRVHIFSYLYRPPIFNPFSLLKFAIEMEVKGMVKTFEENHILSALEKYSSLGGGRIPLETSSLNSGGSHV